MFLHLLCSNKGEVIFVWAVCLCSAIGDAALCVSAETHLCPYVIYLSLVSPLYNMNKTGV